jgi:hypothetical protein
MATSCVIIHLHEVGALTSIIVNGIRVRLFVDKTTYQSVIEYVQNLIADYTKAGFELKTFGITSIREDNMISVWTLVRDPK